MTSAENAPKRRARFGVSGEKPRYFHEKRKNQRKAKRRKETKDDVSKKRAQATGAFFLDVDSLKLQTGVLINKKRKRHPRFGCRLCVTVEVCVFLLSLFSLLLSFFLKKERRIKANHSFTSASARAQNSGRPSVSPRREGSIPAVSSASEISSLVRPSAEVRQL